MIQPPDRQAAAPTGQAEADALVEVTAALLLPLLRGLDTLRFAARHFHPPHLSALAEAVSPAVAPIDAGLPEFRTALWPERLHELRNSISNAAEIVSGAFAGLGEASKAEDVRAARRALRLYADACEALWPAVRLSPVVSRFFLDGPARDDEALCARLETAEPGTTHTGVFHFANEVGTRGGYSLYVPESYDPTAPPLLVAALHGGSGHGRSFLWSWLPAARAAGLVLLAPTSVGRTWALQGDDEDTPNLHRILAEVRGRWRIDERKLLLTGMSDGGTFCWTSGLLGDSAFTHLAPFSASFHPLLLEFAEQDRLRGLPVHIVHGALDWMFPAGIARTAAQALKARGANVVHREIPDLSHTFATDEALTVLRWFEDTPAATLPKAVGLHERRSF